MEEKALAGDFTQGSIANKLIRFMIPILGALVLQAMYGAVDLLVVGQFGTDAGISAVSTGSNVINLNGSEKSSVVRSYFLPLWLRY